MNHHHLVTRAQMLAYDRVGSVPNALPVVSVHRDSHMIPSRNGNVPVWCGSLRGDITHSDEKDRSERGKPTKQIRALTGNNTVSLTDIRRSEQSIGQLRNVTGHAMFDSAVTSTNNPHGECT